MPLLLNAQMTVAAAPGTGTVTLGAATAGSLTWAAGGALDGIAYSYRIEEGAAWEIGTGTYTASGTTLSRGVSKSSNANAAVAFGAGATVSYVAQPGDIQAALGFTPPQQGTGIGQLANVLKFGWTAAGLRLTVDVADQGLVWHDAIATKSLAATGYQKLPSGLIVQWGSVTNAASDFAITFPTAFPSACVFAVASPSASTNAAQMYGANVDQVTASGMAIRARVTSGGTTQTAASLPVFWLAFGY